MDADGIELGALILFSPRVEEAVAFYRILGVPLAAEEHDAGAPHFACDLGAVHFAILPAEGPDTTSNPYRSGGSSYFGFVVSSLRGCLANLRASGGRVLQDAESYPWGPRALVEDPDGRVVEVFERRPTP